MGRAGIFCRSAALTMAALASPALAQDSPVVGEFPGIRTARRHRGRRPTTIARRAGGSQRSAPRQDAAAQRGDGRGAGRRNPALSGHRLERRLAGDPRHAARSARRTTTSACRSSAGACRQRRAGTHRPSQSLFGIGYSEGLESAVRRFQDNNGLRVTGPRGQADAAGPEHSGAGASAAAARQPAAPAGT